MTVVILVAVMICLINFLISLIIIRQNFTNEFRKFSKTVLLSLVIRLIVMLVIAWLGLKIFTEFRNTFALTLLISFFVLTILEVIYIQFRLNYLNLKNEN